MRWSHRRGAPEGMGELHAPARRRSNINSWRHPLFPLDRRSVTGRTWALHASHSQRSKKERHHRGLSQKPGGDTPDSQTRCRRAHGDFRGPGSPYIGLGRPRSRLDCGRSGGEGRGICCGSCRSGWGGCDCRARPYQA